MKVISQSELKEILNYDPVTGIFTWKKKIADKVVIGNIAGSLKPNGYIIIRINKQNYRAHRLAFLYMTGSIPDQVDHINHNQSDNSWNNLEASSYSLNGKNHPKTKRNSTGFVGVSQRKDGKYIARIYVNKKHIFLGVFDNIQDAIKEREAANIKYGFHRNHGT